ncbi:nicotinate-nucleotide--dimethylbenzimidazole phosphoribosyltransferase [Marinitenerispora sediminis]|uniref:Nicotinate-nucleotide--dimethylbenzimidazole phosphoribosyltransferase n=1 Tax=Marinitenerispora sediminis TaxID=1931232 RepID=A0A368T3F4_9ACTN|nr:nicotinate-nucleotide--dimethylbenzimidazole phosphoribosyltransferase [Marinitenerispora sediminis]RCV49335.1 5,6-dimethylbenzimidazole synthase [Marinitenerispora sediminis]RCV50113.1 5,6-dimethylbenzimidazole synthase [Marinitenerispora sediminis]RCV56456.1 5,6-dimethylbenzimidazole synthase [Marinitenerispora sediminis]
MTADDTTPDADRTDDTGRWAAVRRDPPAAQAAPPLGGLLDDLPEQGRGAGSLYPPTEPARRNPFHGTTVHPVRGRAEADVGDVLAEPSAGSPPTPPLRTEAARPEPDIAGPAADDAPASAAPAAAPAAGRTEAAPQAPEADADTGAEPNVIPFRGAGQDRGAGPAGTRRPPEPSAAPPARLRAADATAPAAPGPSAPEPQGDSSTVNAHAAAPLPESDEPETAAPPPAVAPPAPAGPETPAAGRHAYSEAARTAVYRAIQDRRDVRVGFRADPVPDEVLTRVLSAAHQAPSVGFSQPWDFVVIHDEKLRASVQRLVQREREEYGRALPGARARAFSGLKVEAILDTPVNVVVTVDPTRGGRHTLGRHAQPQTAGYSAALAVENMWLAARAEGLGVGWVSFFAERDLARALDLPPHLEVVAYLCVGYVDEFPTEPELSLGGWAQRRPLSWAVHRDQYGRRGLPGEDPTSLLEETVSAIRPLNQRALGEARERQSRMTTPPGALGVLEDIAAQLAGLAGEAPPPLPEPAAVAVFAGDHGVHAQGVTPWPQEVTGQMVRNFLSGGAVVNAFANQVGAEVTVVDVGVVDDLPTVPGLLPRKIARGTADFTRGPAMSRTQVGYAIEAGIEVARDLVAAGNRCLVTGDMGIANTTPSAALVAAFTGREPAEVTGRGTGVDDAMHEHKIEVVRQALRANPVDPADPVGTLAALGGLEHAALTGFILGGAALRVPVVLDGVIAGAAALAAAAIAPESMSACVAGHRSSEPGHAAVLEHLELRPLVDLELRLGEGSGALLAVPLLQGAVRALREVATFDGAGVSERK